MMRLIGLANLGMNNNVPLPPLAGEGVRAGKNFLLLLLLCTALLSLAQSTVAQSTVAQTISLNDITHWVGEGSNRAGLIIDWDRSAGEGDARIWGYRWEGQATGSQMLIDVLTADDRLYAKLGGEFFTFGLGYDINLATPFAIDDGSMFDERGITSGTTGTSDGAASIDPLDQYGEGWFTQFWHYAVAESDHPTSGTIDAADWESSQVGMFARPLTDGDWDAWTYTVPFDFGAFPDLPVLTPTTLLGDYNNDGVVDAADYTTWRATLGDTLPAGEGADGNQNGLVDEPDLAVWRSHYGQTTSGASQSVAVPEPMSMTTALLCLALLSWYRQTTLNTTQH